MNCEESSEVLKVELEEMIGQVKDWKDEMTTEMEVVQKEISNIKDKQVFLRVRVGDLEETTTRWVDELVHQAAETKSDMEALIAEKYNEIVERKKWKDNRVSREHDFLYP